jgi:hypothetical protein
MIRSAQLARMDQNAQADTWLSNADDGVNYPIAPVIKVEIVQIADLAIAGVNSITNQLPATSQQRYLLSVLNRTFISPPSQSNSR